MEDRQSKTLTMAVAPWCDEAARLFAGTLRRSPCFTVDDYRREIEENPDARLLRVSHGDALVGYVALRLVRRGGGVEGEIMAAAGRLPGIDLTAAIVPILESMFEGVRAFRVDTARRGLVKKLARMGYSVTHCTLRKVVPC